MGYKFAIGVQKVGYKQGANRLLLLFKVLGLGLAIGINKFWIGLKQWRGDAIKQWEIKIAIQLNFYCLICMPKRGTLGTSFQAGTRSGVQTG